MADKNSEKMVVLVDEHDNKMGVEEKMKAHQDGGMLHRAISIIVLNPKGQMMLQRRSDAKYHSAGLWANTCCSHPTDGESVIAAAHRRLKQEMGFDCEMDEAFTFIYHTYVGKGLTEWEFDHVLLGMYDGEPKPNPEEVKEWKWASLEWVKDDMGKNKDSYAEWFKILMTDASVAGKLARSVKKFLDDKRVSTSL
jgi:isopentenyl-diphosphate delta-isomerase